VKTAKQFIDTITTGFALGLMLALALITLDIRTSDAGVGAGPYPDAHWEYETKTLTKNGAAMSNINATRRCTNRRLDATRARLLDCNGRRRDFASGTYGFTIPTDAYDVHTSAATEVLPGGRGRVFRSWTGVGTGTSADEHPEFRVKVTRQRDLRVDRVSVTYTTKIWVGGGEPTPSTDGLTDPGPSAQYQSAQAICDGAERTTLTPEPGDRWWRATECTKLVNYWSGAYTYVLFTIVQYKDQYGVDTARAFNCESSDSFDNINIKGLVAAYSGPSSVMSGHRCDHYAWQYAKNAWVG
jgi:hypothetical protein